MLDLLTLIYGVTLRHFFIVRALEQRELGDRALRVTMSPLYGALLGSPRFFR